jgi:hypothetical protein
MTNGRVRIGHKKIFQKVNPKKVLLQHFNNNSVLVETGGVMFLKNRTDTVSKPVSCTWKILIIGLIIN